MAGQSLRPQAAAADLRRRIHADFAVLRHGDIADATDCFPRAARADRRRVTATGPGDPARNLSQGASRPCHGSVWTGHFVGADSWAHAWRMDHRQLQLALDFLSESSGRRAFAFPDEPL